MLYFNEVDLWALIPVIFIVVGVLAIKKGFYTVEFNKSRGIVLAGKKPQARIEDIAGLQILRKIVIDRNRNHSEWRWTSYELNLVFNDGKRFNLEDSGDIKNTKMIARELSQFLECPIWDRSDPNKSPNIEMEVE